MEEKLPFADDQQRQIFDKWLAGTFTFLKHALVMQDKGDEHSITVNIPDGNNSEFEGQVTFTVRRKQ